jgi:hypothetical protein
MSAAVVFTSLTPRGPWGWLFRLALVTRPTVLGPSVRIVKEGHDGDAGRDYRGSDGKSNIARGHRRGEDTQNQTQQCLGGVVGMRCGTVQMSGYAVSPQDWVIGRDGCGVSDGQYIRESKCWLELY